MQSEQKIQSECGGGGSSGILVFETMGVGWGSRKRYSE